MRSHFLFTLLFSVGGSIFAQGMDLNSKGQADARVLFSTFTVILSTVTTTTTIPTTTTCTTSSTAMSACSAPKGRRRRGILFDEAEKDGFGRRGLFYSEDEAELNDGSITIPVNHAKRSTIEDTLSSVTIDTVNLIPLTIQSGFSLPEEFSAGSPRFKLAYGTTTVTSTTTSTATKSLTIACVSITDYQVCSGTG